LRRQAPSHPRRPLTNKTPACSRADRIFCSIRGWHLSQGPTPRSNRRTVQVEIPDTCASIPSSHFNKVRA
jgi:hypothetical protein